MQVTRHQFRARLLLCCFGIELFTNGKVCGERHLTVLEKRCHPHNDSGGDGLEGAGSNRGRLTIANDFDRGLLADAGCDRRRRHQIHILRRGNLVQIMRDYFRGFNQTGFDKDLFLRQE